MPVGSKYHIRALNLNFQAMMDLNFQLEAAPLRKGFDSLRAGHGQEAKELFASAVLLSSTAAAPHVDAIYGMGLLDMFKHCCLS